MSDGTSSGTRLTRLAERLQQPFHRNGRPTRLHPAAVWSEASSTAAQALTPAWRTVPSTRTATDSVRVDPEFYVTASRVP